jgi:DNA-binding MarR family transcriptional regulator
MQLYLLGRQLTKVGEAALQGPGEDPLGAGVRAVLEDIATAPESSISEITARVGFPQSHVSNAVARLRKVGVVETIADRADGRRTLVRVTPEFHRQIAQRRTRPIDTALITTMGTEDPDVLAEAHAALDILARLILRSPRAAEQ